MRKGEKNVVDLPAKIQRLCMDNIRPSPLWTSDYTWGPLGVFISQTNHCKSSPLRKFFVILTFRHGDKQAHCKHSNVSTAILLLSCLGLGGI